MTAQLRVSVAVILDQSGKILGTRRNSDRLLGGKFEFVGGKIEPYELPRQALIREIKEELGDDAVVGPMVGAPVFRQLDYADITLYPFFAVLVTHNLKHTAASQFVFGSVEELKQYQWLLPSYPILARLKAYSKKQLAGLATQLLAQRKEDLMTSKEQKRSTWLAMMNRRYAAKQFDATKHIEKQDWQTIIESGRLSPSSMGLEPWQFFDINSAKLREKIGKVAWGLQRQLPGLDHLLLVATRKHMVPDDPYLKDFIINFKHYDYEKFAPKLGDYQQNDAQMTTERAIDDWSKKQAYIAMGNMMSAAAFLDIDSCPIEGFNYPAVDKIMLEAGVYDPKDYTAAYMIAFGYATTPVKPKLRRDMSDVYHEIN